MMLRYLGKGMLSTFLLPMSKSLCSPGSTHPMHVLGIALATIRVALDILCISGRDYILLEWLVG